MPESHILRIGVVSNVIKLRIRVEFADDEETQSKVYRDVLFDKLQVNEGMLVENAVAQQPKRI